MVRDLRHTHVMRPDPQPTPEHIERAHAGIEILDPDWRDHPYIAHEADHQAHLPDSAHSRRSARDIMLESDKAHEHNSPWEAMAVTFECGHLALMTRNAVCMGVGAFGGCRVCPSPDGHAVERMVCKIEPTGTLHEAYTKP